MRTKLLVEQKLDKIRSLIRTAELHTARMERNEAYEAYDKIREVLHQIQTLMHTETQD
jgi:hypothetical protein